MIIYFAGSYENEPRQLQIADEIGVPYNRLLSFFYKKEVTTFMDVVMGINLSINSAKRKIKKWKRHKERVLKNTDQQRERKDIVPRTLNKDKRKIVTQELSDRLFNPDPEPLPVRPPKDEKVIELTIAPEDLQKAQEELKQRQAEKADKLQHVTISLIDSKITSLQREIADLEELKTQIQEVADAQA